MKRNRMILWNIQFMLCLLTAMMLMACGSASENATVSSAPQQAKTESYSGAAPSTAPGSGSDELGQVLEQAQEPRLIIYTGDMELIVQDANKATVDIAKIAETAGGYVSESNIFRDNEVPRGQMVIKVPGNTYQQVLSDLRAAAIRVERETSASQDITEEYVDLEARKTNLQLTESALQDLLETRKETGNTEDILQVYRELTDVRGQIEQIQGRLNYLSRSVALATITITITPDVLSQPLQVAGWQPKGVAKEAVQALIGGLQALANFWIWLIIFVLPMLIIFLGPVVLILWLMVSWWQRRNSRKKAVKSAANEVKPDKPAM